MEPPSYRDEDPVIINTEVSGNARILPIYGGRNHDGAERRPMFFLRVQLPDSGNEFEESVLRVPVENDGALHSLSSAERVEDVHSSSNTADNAHSDSAGNDVTQTILPSAPIAEAARSGSPPPSYQQIHPSLSLEDMPPGADDDVPPPPYIMFSDPESPQQIIQVLSASDNELAYCSICDTWGGRLRCPGGTYGHVQRDLVLRLIEVSRQRSLLRHDGGQAPRPRQNDRRRPN